MKTKPILVAFLVAVLIIIAALCQWFSFMKPQVKPEIQNDDPILQSAPVAAQTVVNDIPKGETFTITAYDLSVESCGKPLGHPKRGLTATGYDLSGKDLESARTIAVDPDVIPLGAKVMIRFFDESLKRFNGIYTARDTGGAIQGNKIDLFLGDFYSDKPAEEVWAFGKRKAEVIIVAHN